MPRRERRLSAASTYGASLCARDWKARSGGGRGVEARRELFLLALHARVAYSHAHRSVPVPVRTTDGTVLEEPSACWGGYRIAVQLSPSLLSAVTCTDYSNPEPDLVILDTVTPVL